MRISFHKEEPPVEMTPEIKKAFRIAYDALEKTEIPSGTNDEKAEAFEKIGADFAELKRFSFNNPIAGLLLLAVYNYISICSTKESGL